MLSRIYKVLKKPKRQANEKFNLKWGILTKEEILKWWNTTAENNSFKFYTLAIQNNSNCLDISLEYVRLKNKQAKTNKQNPDSCCYVCGKRGTDRTTIEINVDGPQRTENQSTKRLPYTTLGHIFKAAIAC